MTLATVFFYLFVTTALSNICYEMLKGFRKHASQVVGMMTTVFLFADYFHYSWYINLGIS